jgi:hypothetical protein
MNQQLEIKIEWISRFENIYNRHNGQGEKIRARVIELRRKMQEVPTTHFMISIWQEGRVCESGRE